LRRLAIPATVLLFLAVAVLSVLVAIWGKPSTGQASVDVMVIDWPGYGQVMQLTYCVQRGAALFIREWIPADPGKELQVPARLLGVKWGTGWMMPQGRGMVAIWLDVSSLWSSIYMPYRYLIVRDVPLSTEDPTVSLGKRQVLDFAPGAPGIEAQDAPPAVEIPISPEGIQEVVLVVSRDGYTPVRFAVQKGVPVRLTFRQLGRVGCGDELLFPIGPDEYATLKLDSPEDKKTLEFTPEVAGEYPFYCPFTKYGGLLIVRN
jgi:hypothetical protein